MAATKFLEALGKRKELEDYEGDYNSVLSDLIITYEVEHHARSRSTPQEMLRYLLETRKVSQAELSGATRIGTPIIEETLSGK